MTERHNRKEFQSVLSFTIAPRFSIFFCHTEKQNSYCQTRHPMDNAPDNQNSWEKLSVGVHVHKHPSFKIMALLLIAGTMLSCERTGENIDGPDLTIGNVLRLDIPAPFTSLDPTREESGSVLVFSFLYDSLFSMNEEGELVPELATSFHYDPQDLAWTIYLRNGPRFHNGKPVKVSDVTYSLHERLKNLRPELYQSIERIAPLTDGAVRIVLKKDDPEFLSKVYHTEIIPEPVAGAVDYYSHPIGSGPFMFEYRSGEGEVSLVANQDYYKGRPPLDRITFHYEADSEKSWARLITGSTDAAFGIHPVDNDMLSDHQDLFYLNAHTHPLYAILLYNMHASILSSSNIRLALSFAIDKETIIEDVLKGYGQIAAGPIALTSPYHNQDLKPVPYDPQQGIRLLVQAGWAYDEKGKYLRKDGAPFELTILHAEKDRIMKGVAEYLQLYLNDIGIKAHIVPLPIDEINRRYVRNTEFQAVLTEMDGGTNSPGFLKRQWSPSWPGRSAAGGFEYRDLTKILTEAERESRPERVKDLLQEAEGLIISLQPGTFLFHRTTLDVISRRIDFPYPFSLSPTDIYRLRFASVRNRTTSGK